MGYLHMYFIGILCSLTILVIYNRSNISKHTEWGKLPAAMVYGFAAASWVGIVLFSVLIAADFMDEYMFKPTNFFPRFKKFNKFIKGEES